MTIAVLGATGRTGSRVARGLLEQGHKVRTLGRDTATLSAYWDLGAEIRVGSMTDQAYLTKSLQGTRAVYALLPHDPFVEGYLAQQRAAGEALVNAIRDSGVQHIVVLSSLGAEQPSGTGAIESLHDQEARLRALPGVNVIFLRPALFFETLEASLPVVRATGVLIDAVAPDLPVAMISTRDIAAAAVHALASLDWRGIHVQELLGPEDLTYREVARQLGRALDLPDLQYVQVAYEEMARMLREAGFAPDIAELAVGISRGLNEGRIRPLAGRTAANTTPTLFEQYASELARAEEPVTPYGSFALEDRFTRAASPAAAGGKLPTRSG